MTEQGRELRPFWEVGSTDVITRFLLEGEGHLLCRSSWCGSIWRRGELVVLHPNARPSSCGASWYTIGTKYVTPLMALFLDLMKQRLLGEEA